MKINSNEIRKHLLIMRYFCLFDKIVKKERMESIIDVMSDWNSDNIDNRASIVRIENGNQDGT